MQNLPKESHNEATHQHPITPDINFYGNLETIRHLVQKSSRLQTLQSFLEAQENSLPALQSFHPAEQSTVVCKKRQTVIT